VAHRLIPTATIDEVKQGGARELAQEDEVPIWGMGEARGSPTMEVDAGDRPEEGSKLELERLASGMLVR
jgi:hypothetical protein